jgi:cell division protein FtsI/penicillin-binding protein 2
VLLNGLGLVLIHRLDLETPGEEAAPAQLVRTTRSGGSTVSAAGSRPTRQVMRPTTAARLRELVTDVVEEGTGRNAVIAGATVGGKTGTAQHGVGNHGTPYAWFICWARDDADTEPRVAVAVVVEDASARRGDISGGGTAAPIAKAVREAVLHSPPGGRRAGFIRRQARPVVGG